MSINTFKETDFNIEGSVKKVFLRILSFVKPYWKWMAGFLFAIMITSIFRRYFKKDVMVFLFGDGNISSN